MAASEFKKYINMYFNLQCDTFVSFLKNISVSIVIKKNKFKKQISSLLLLLLFYCGVFPFDLSEL